MKMQKIISEKNNVLLDILHNTALRNVSRWEEAILPFFPYRIEHKYSHVKFNILFFKKLKINDFCMIKKNDRIAEKNYIWRTLWMQRIHLYHCEWVKGRLSWVLGGEFHSPTMFLYILHAHCSYCPIYKSESHDSLFRNAHGKHRLMFYSHMVNLCILYLWSLLIRITSSSFLPD